MRILPMCFYSIIQTSQVLILLSESQMLLALHALVATSNVITYLQLLCMPSFVYTFVWCLLHNSNQHMMEKLLEKFIGLDLPIRMMMFAFQVAHL